MPRRSARSNKGVPPKFLDDFTATMSDTSQDENREDSGSENEQDQTVVAPADSIMVDLQKQIKELQSRLATSEVETASLRQQMSSINLAAASVSAQALNQNNPVAVHTTIASDQSAANAIAPIFNPGNATGQIATTLVSQAAAVSQRDTSAVAQSYYFANANHSDNFAVAPRSAIACSASHSDNFAVAPHSVTTSSACHSDNFAVAPSSATFSSACHSNNLNVAARYAAASSACHSDNFAIASSFTSASSACRNDIFSIAQRHNLNNFPCQGDTAVMPNLISASHRDTFAIAPCSMTASHCHNPATAQRFAPTAANNISYNFADSSYNSANYFRQFPEITQYREPVTSSCAYSTVPIASMTESLPNTTGVYSSNQHITGNNEYMYNPSSIPPQFLPTRSQPCYQTKILPIRKLIDLPEFKGLPEQWPMFFVSYKETTAAYGYTNLENLSRLQKALKGEAREQVEALLIHPESVNAVLNTLEFRYGRPEILIKSQIAQVRSFQPISENKMTDLISFSLKVSNLTAFLENSCAMSHLTNPTLLEELIGKLPYSKREDWVRHTFSIQPYSPNIKDFSVWLRHSATFVSLAAEMTCKKPSLTSTDKKGKFANTILTISEERKNKLGCVVCQENHPLYKCTQFKNVTVDQRWKIIKSNHLCFCCLRTGHSATNCPQRRECGKSFCKRIHNRLLHENIENGSNQEKFIKSTVTDSAGKQPTITQPIVTTILNDNINTTLFKYLPVELSGPKGSCRIIAFFDDGAKISLLEEDIANKLGLKGSSDLLQLRWIGNKTTSEMSQHINFEISATRQNANKFYMKNVRTTKKLFLPPQSLNLNVFRNKYAQLSSIDIDDYVDAVPKLLIGVPHISIMRPLEVYNFDEGFSAYRTKLGWTLFGSNEENNLDAVVGHIDLNSNLLHELHKQIDDYFSLESLVTKTPKPLESEIDKRAEKILIETSKKVQTQYETGLLWKYTEFEFPDSYNMAFDRLRTVEKKMLKDEVFADWYKGKINEYVDKFYARKLSPKEVTNTDNHTWYLPHFAVCNVNKGNKLRLVFDAAAKSHNISLNSMLMKGPEKYQPKPLLAILLKFRQSKIGVCGDIREMFHRINIRQQDQNAQRFLWRDGNSSAEPDVYVMRAMIFGSASSPCSAQFIKNLNADQYRNEFPRAVEAITNNHYVDDYVDSFNTCEEAIVVTKEIINIHTQAGFELRGFVSNSREFLQAINCSSSTYPIITTMDHRESTTEKILGMHWNPGDDTFCFTLSFAKMKKAVLDGHKRPTKSEVLSLTMSIFDPFGFLANVVIVSKIFMQELWRLKLGWNEEVPEDIYCRWYDWYSSLESLRDFRVPRCYHSFFTSEIANVQLHVCVDASELAYAAVGYWRVEYEHNIEVVFVLGKTRCSPLKTVSIPRLELQAAVLGVHLKETILTSHDVKPSKIVFWSDSKTVIQWIKSDSRRYKQFVAHRISEILDMSEIDQWRWVPSLQNPADEATRLKTDVKKVQNSKWISGPSYLKSSESDWPPMPADFTNFEVATEKRSKFIFSIGVDGIFPFERYSNYYTLLKVMSWVRRAVFNFKQRRNHHRCKLDSSVGSLVPLTVAEIKDSELLLCKIVQGISFPTEIRLLSSGKPIPKTSTIFKLTPVLDESGIVRLGGRIDNAECVSYDVKRPIILPKIHAFSNLIIQNFHENFRHQNQEAIVCAIRAKFWIPSLRSLVRSIKSKCQFCKIKSANPEPPLMGQLPIDRLTAYERPFSYTGLDYFGPVYVAIGRRREKRWVALFTCLSIRAIHLELARDLSADAAILCLRNFINRRGLPVRIRSDQGTNFIGASKEEWVATSSRIQNECTKRGIEWMFNTPGNPSAGGAWERMVGCVKRVLAVALKEKAPQIETLQSFLIEAENLVNSRPLTHLPIETTDSEPLTPNHFLLGCPNHIQTPKIDLKTCLKKQWHISQQLKQSFWKRWVLEYIPTLTRRTKWHRSVDPLQIGDIVIICDENESRGEWKRGRIEEVFLATDGQVRSAVVKTATGYLRRPASKLAKLDVIEKLAKSKHSTAAAAQAQQLKSKDTVEKKLISTSPAVRLDDNVCRVCLNSEGIVAIFDGYGTDEQFRYCTLLEVSEADGLPNKLCQICTDHLKIAYDFRFQASYAEKYLRKTIFLPVLKKELDVEHDECNKNLKLSQQSEVASLELDENMQEIGQMLACDALDEGLEPGMELSDNGNNLGSSFCDEDGNLSESDGLSDHFSDAFSTGSNYRNIECSEEERKYKLNAENLQNTIFGGKQQSEHRKSTNHLSSDTSIELKQNANADITYDYYYSSKEKQIPDHPRVVAEKQSTSMKTQKWPSQDSEIKEKTLKLLELVQLQEKEAKHNKEKIECNICGTNFTHINSLKQHLMKHSGEKPFKCEFCGKCFARKTILTIHRRLHTGDRPYRCDECIRKFVTKEALNRHKEREHGDHAEESCAKKKITYICPICDKARCSKYSLAAHMRTHHSDKESTKPDEKKLKLVQQKQTAIQNKPRRPRLTVDTKEKRSKSIKYCKVCQQGFSSKWELVTHQKAHELNQTFECDICPRSFEKKYQLLYHLQTHDNGEEVIKKYVHSIAAAAQQKECKALNDKEVEHTQLSQRQKNKIPCIAVRRSKRGKRGLDGNLAITELDGKVKEEQLAISENSSKLLLRKTKNHTGVQVNRVESLDQATKTSSCAFTKCRAPKENLKSLKNELKCKLCKQVFTHSSSLKVHMMKHSGDRPFQCEHCGKSFSRTNVLNIHRRLHTGEKPYKCPLCESAFVTKEALLRHVAKLHNQSVINDRREFTCGTCYAVLPNKSLFDNHMQYHTEEEQQHKDTNNSNSSNKETLPLFKCNLCGASFPSLSSYSCHLDVHEPPKTFQCDICKIQFKEKFKLRYHMQQHKIEEEYCKICGEVFTIKEELIRHVKRKHFDARSLDFQCAECSIGLYDMRDLKEHLYEAHAVSTQGLNTCDFCRLDFNTVQEYYHHIYAMHDDVCKACNECGDYFDSRKKFDEHFLSHYIS